MKFEIRTMRTSLLNASHSRAIELHLDTPVTEELKGVISKVRGVCLNHRVDYALMSTADALDVALTTFLATRMHRQRAKA